MASADSSQDSLSPKTTQLPKSEFVSLAYHDIFSYPMTKGELTKWKFGKEIKDQNTRIARKIGKYYFLKNGKTNIFKREGRSKASLKKIKIAKKAAQTLAALPTVKMVGITGALAMMNAEPESDIDFIVVCKANTLWTTRLMVYLTLDLLGIPRRKYGLRKEKNRLCLNMWLDETALVWDKDDRNLYSAHEIAQIIPLLNKDKTYERFINKISWIGSYWPNAVRIPGSIPKSKDAASPISVFEPFARTLQLWYMRKKITREIVSPTKAIFHPKDWGKIVAKALLRRLS